jgi:hypothetical protein
MCEVVVWNYSTNSLNENYPYVLFLEENILTEMIKNSIITPKIIKISNDFEIGMFEILLNKQISIFNTGNNTYIDFDKKITLATSLFNDKTNSRSSKSFDENIERRDPFHLMAIIKNSWIKK